jgi:hypothetical protein
MKIWRRVRPMNAPTRKRCTARHLVHCRAYTTPSHGSEGLYELEIRWRSCVWLVQLKSSRAGVPRWLSRAEKQQLLQCCQRKKLQPIIALYTKERTLYYTANTRQRIASSRH